jgi:hypothetical protein
LVAIAGAAIVWFICCRRNRKEETMPKRTLKIQNENIEDEELMTHLEIIPEVSQESNESLMTLIQLRPS